MSPSVIHGPLGTGKTMMVTETILQVYTIQKDARILVWAPSNRVANHILQKVLGERAAPL